MVIKLATMLQPTEGRYKLMALCIQKNKQTEIALDTACDQATIVSLVGNQLFCCCCSSFYCCHFAVILFVRFTSVMLCVCDKIYNLRKTVIMVFATQNKRNSNNNNYYNNSNSYEGSMWPVVCVTNKKDDIVCQKFQHFQQAKADVSRCGLGRCNGDQCRKCFEEEWKWRIKKRND